MGEEDVSSSNPSGFYQCHNEETFCKVCIRQYASKVEFRKHLKTSKHKLRAASTNAGDEVSNVMTRNGDEYGYYCCNSCLRVFGEDEFKKHQQETGHSDSVKVSKIDFK